MPDTIADEIDIQTNEMVGFIGGGQMACALAAGAVRKQVLRSTQLWFAEPAVAQRESLTATFPEATVVADGLEVLHACDRVFLSVKPQVLTTIGPKLSRIIGSRHLLVSIAAGISLGQLEELFGTKRIIRVMPNTPCQVGAGASAIAPGLAASDEDIQWVEQVMGAVGLTVRIPDSLMHAVTGLSGSGPAYAYLVIEALSDGGVAQGLPRDLSIQLAAQTVLGAAKMVLETGKHPATLKDQVTSPGGTTIAALRVLERSATRSALIEAVIEAAERSRQLGK